MRSDQLILMLEPSWDCSCYRWSVLLTASQNPYPIKYQNLQFSLPYLWYGQNIATQGVQELFLLEYGPKCPWR